MRGGVVIIHAMVCLQSQPTAGRPTAITDDSMDSSLLEKYEIEAIIIDSFGKSVTWYTILVLVVLYSSV